MNILFLIQARLGSTRYPKKMLANIFAEFNLINVIINRVMMSNYCTKENLYVLTTDNEIDDELVLILKDMGVNYYRGNETNVYKRFYDFIQMHEFIIKKKVDYFVRICGDNPFIEPLFIDDLINEIEPEIDYFSYKDNCNNPAILTHYGFFCEVIKRDSFIKRDDMVNTKYLKEHVTPVFYSNNFFRCKYLDIPQGIQRNDIRLTVDTQKDLFVAKKIIFDLNKLDYNYMEVLDIINSNVDLLSIMKSNIMNNNKGDRDE